MIKHIEFHRRGSMSSIVGGGWTKEEDKAFENGIAKYWSADDSKNNRWEKIASMVPSKTIAELKQHYETLLEDIVAIESGEIPFPCYLEDEMTSSVVKNQEKRPSVYSYESMFSPRSQGSKAGSKSDPERRKGIPWTEEEHRLFLLGLDKFGKGDWRSISRNFVISRTPTQVASHAQKYFVRLTSMNRDRRRSSIHDITSINNGDVSLTSSQGPITGQQANANPSAPVNFRPAPKHFPGPTGHSMMAAIGTPVIIPPGLHPPYVPVAYPVPPQIVHQP